MIIYKITNNVTNKSYIGQTTKSLLQRWKRHVWYANNTQKNILFYNSIRKHGLECWNLEILEKVATRELLNEREIHWISYYDTFNNGYNSTTGGEQFTQHSKLSRQKMSIAAKNRVISEETKRKMSDAQRGEKHPNYGKHLSPETIAKITLANQNSNKGRIPKNKNLITINKKGIIKYIPVSEKEEYLNNGYSLGRK